MWDTLRYFFSSNDGYLPDGSDYPGGGLIQWIETLVNFIISHPALLILVLAPVLIGFSVGLLKRLKNM